MALSKRDSEKLVMLADDKGYIYFKDIHRTFPYLEKEDMYDLIGDDFYTTGLSGYKMPKSLPLLFWTECPDRYRKGYEFRPIDLFCLSIYGDDLRYAKTKELDAERMAKQTLNWAKVSATLSAVAIIVSVILAVCF